jgi:hypothetical protein
LVLKNSFFYIRITENFDTFLYTQLELQKSKKDSESFHHKEMISV